MFNTAIESAIDVATSSFDPLAKLTKDIAAGAVLIATINAIAVGYLVFSGKVVDRSARALDRVRHAPAELTIVALAVTVIIVICHEACTGKRNTAPRRSPLGPCGPRVRGAGSS